jgi:uncharacterized protein
MTDALRADHSVLFSYRRSVGGADRLFLAGLAKGEVWGSRDSDGTVTVPPLDWNPETGDPTSDFVLLGAEGTVRSWTWVADPAPEHPLTRPFALALILLRGADTALLHVVDVPDESRMRTGMTVRADWRVERVGSILDIRAFVPSWYDRTSPVVTPRATAAAALPPAPEVVSDVQLDYTYEPGLTLSGFLRALGERRILGGRCPSCSGVYVPPHAACPVCRVGPMELMEMGDRGTITSYTVVHLPFHGMTIDLPFVCAFIRLDGADVPFAHLLGEVAPHEVRVGQRVEAVWVPDEELVPTWESIRHFRPCDLRPDAAGGAGR